jgi:hypothetical protein
VSFPHPTHMALITDDLLSVMSGVHEARPQEMQMPLEDFENPTEANAISRRRIPGL